MAKSKTMNRKTSQSETPVFVNLLSDAGFEAVKALQKKVLSEEPSVELKALNEKIIPNKGFRSRR